MHNSNISALKTILFFMAFAIASIHPAMAQQEFSIQSEAMQDTREIVVHLPKNYDANSEKGYPVIYMTNAGSTDKLVAEIASYFNWTEIMPEVIVIGLKDTGRNPYFLPHYYSFERDGKEVFGDGGKMLAYIKDELIPFADKKIKTDGRKIFVGHSWAGQFLTYTMSQSPGLFDAYFITSPAFGRAEKFSEKTFEAVERTLKQDLDFPDFVYVSVGADEEALMLSYYYRLTALLKLHLTEKVKFYHEVHDSANHMNVAAISIPKALQLYFAAGPEAE